MAAVPFPDKRGSLGRKMTSDARICFVKTFDELYAEFERPYSTRGSGTSRRWLPAFMPRARRCWKRPVGVARRRARIERASGRGDSAPLYWVQVLMLGRGVTLEDVYRYL